MSYLSIKNLCKRYSKKSEFNLSKISFDVEKGDIVSIVGESGCGKTTLLKLISGLEVADSGMISLDGNILYNSKKFIEAENRKIILVFQDYALFPHLSVYKNISYGLNIKSKELEKNKIKDILNLMGLSNYEKKYPHELSGGEQQRLSLSRALVLNPKLLLLDEAFSNLNHNLHLELVRKLVKILKEKNCTTLFVTHDKGDILSLMDKVLMIRKGVQKQYDKPLELYYNPKNEYVAYFFGIINLFHIKKDYELKKNINFLNLISNSEKNNKKIFIRPHDFEVTLNERESIPIIIKEYYFCGEYYEIIGLISKYNEKEYIITLYLNLKEKPKKGEKLYIKVRSNSICYIDK